MSPVLRRHFLTCCTLSVLAAGRRRRLVPSDESAADPGFARFLRTLRAAAQTENSAAFASLCAEDVIVGVDGGSGPSALTGQMRAGGWAALRETLTFGAGKYDSGFVIPYLFARFPDDLESTEHLVTVRPGAVLRAAGNTRARVICPLDFDILHTADARPVDGWLRASRLDGLAGWVAVHDVRSLGEPRLFAKKRNGEWKITAWASGA